MKFSTIAFASFIGFAVASPAFAKVDKREAEASPLFAKVDKREAAASPAFAKGKSISPTPYSRVYSHFEVDKREPNPLFAKIDKRDAEAIAEALFAKSKVFLSLSIGWMLTARS